MSKEKNMSVQFPRVLIVNYSAFHQYDGGAITLSNLFADWPVNKLVIVHTDPRGSDSARTIGNFRLKRVLSFPGTSFGIEWRTQKDLMFIESWNNQRHFHRLKSTLPRKIASNCLNFLGIAPLLEKYELSKPLLDFISSFKPEVIYTQLGNIAFARLVLELSRSYKVPYAVHIMDDYPSVLYRNGMLSSVVRGFMHWQLSEICTNARVRFGICQAMCDEYFQRYGVPFLPFHNPVDLLMWSNPPLKKTTHHNRFNIAYVGRVGTGTCHGLKDMCQVVDAWECKDIEITFNLYVNEKEYVQKNFDFLKKLSNNMSLLQAPDNAMSVSAIYRDADILFLPIDFDECSVRFIRLSMPTKVATYMASGRPILVYGPGDVASVKYARDGGWGCVVENRSVEALKDAIVRLCADPYLRSSISERASRLAHLNHDGSMIREKFRTAICDAIQE